MAAICCWSGRVHDGSFKVERVICAVDCGVAVNPDVIRAQMEGGIGMGLSAALGEAITLKKGVVEQTNFHNYPLRLCVVQCVERQLQTLFQVLQNQEVKFF